MCIFVYYVYTYMYAIHIYYYFHTLRGVTAAIPMIVSFVRGSGGQRCCLVYLWRHVPLFGGIQIPVFGCGTQCAFIYTSYTLCT